MLTLPEDIILKIYEFLPFRDISVLYQVSRKYPRINIPITTFNRNTFYNNTIAQSYLLTNGKYELPGLIKDGFLEIKLYWGNTVYHFSFYKNIFREGETIWDYFKKYKYFKKIYNL